VDIVQGILSTAQAIGANPLDLATVISYETGGTFDPLQTGPTTQWGQHRGLIQFGEPQAQQYGVDWNDPLGSQLGPNGAVANYLRGSGYQPGMGLLDLYSTINAGAPGRYGATDANNGGAPGTVADKVNEQMAGHRANAERLLGQQMAATPQQGLLGTVSTSGAPERQPGIFDALLGKLPAPIANRLGSADWRDNMTLALAGMSMNPNQALIGGVQRRMDNRDEERRINQTVQWLQSMGRTDLAELGATGAVSMDALVAEALRPPPAAPQPIEINGQLVDPTTMQVLGDFRDPQSAADRQIRTGPDGIDRYVDTGEPVFPNVDVPPPAPGLTPDQVSAGNTYRDDLKTTLDPFRLAQQGWSNIQTFFTNPGAVSDQALATAFAKVLDPTSVAREGEVAAIQGSGSLSSALQSQLLNAINGTGRLPPEVRQQIAELSVQLYNNQAGPARDAIARFQTMATQAGVPVEQLNAPDQILSGKVPGGIVPQKTSNAPAGPAVINGYTIEEVQ
jgi:hypothetical protein